MGVGHDFFDELKGGAITFLMSWKGGHQFFSFIFKSGFLCLTMFFWIIWCEYSAIFDKKGSWNCVSYAPKIQNFLRQGGAAPLQPLPGGQPLDPCEHLAHRLSFPQFKMEWRPRIRVHNGGRPPLCGSSFLMTVGGNEPLGEFKTGGSMEPLVEMVQIENSLQNYVNLISTFWHGCSWAFKTLKPISFRGLRPLDPRCHNGIFDENSTNRQFSA